MWDSSGNAALPDLIVIFLELQKENLRACLSVLLLTGRTNDTADKLPNPALLLGPEEDRCKGITSCSMLRSEHQKILIIRQHNSLFMKRFSQ